MRQWQERFREQLVLHRAQQVRQQLEEHPEAVRQLQVRCRVPVPPASQRQEQRD